MAHKVTAADLWRGFSRDKIVRFQRDVIRPCQMTRSCEDSQTNTYPETDYKESLKMICFQYYQVFCNCFWSWSSILLVYHRNTISFFSSLAFHRRGDMLEWVKHVFSLMLLLATRTMQRRGEAVETLKRRILARFTSFCSTVAQSIEKHQMKKIFCQITDRISVQTRDQWVKIQKRAAYVVNYKVALLLGVVTAQALVLYFLHKSRASSSIKECHRERYLPHHHMPSAWYYEHIHYYPRPQMKILSAEDGAPPILSQLPVNSREITAATHTTMDRFPAVELTAFRWSGPMVLVVLVRTQSEIASSYSALEDLHSRVEAEGRCRLHIQVVHEEGFRNDHQALQALYPVNSMRNLALGMVTTKLVFMIDADFVPNPGFVWFDMLRTRIKYCEAEPASSLCLHEHLTQHEEKFMDLLRKAEEWRQLLVVPAFQLTEDKLVQYQHSLHVLPHTKEELREAWWNGIVDCFRCDASPDSHQPTEYYRFTDPAVTWPYQVWYKKGYEPFFIASTSHHPKFDTRFRGHGRSKIAHTYLLSVQGFTFWVIPEGFLVELPHPPSLSGKREVQDPLQTWRNDGIYNRYTGEINWMYNITTVSNNSEPENTETSC